MIHLLFLVGILTSSPALAEEEAPCVTLMGALEDPIPENIQVVKQDSGQSADLWTVSSYTKQVLDRVRVGMQLPKEDAGSAGNFMDLMALGEQVFVSTIDSSIDVLFQVKHLTEQTTCEQYDLLLLQCGMEKVRTQRNTQLSNLKYANALRLERVYHFLNDRVRGLEEGSLDPHFKDTTWGKAESFDPKDQNVICYMNSDRTCQSKTVQQCGEQGVPFYTMDACQEIGGTGNAATDQLCPFNTNYAPPSIVGYGCDADVLEQLKKYQPAVDESKDLRKMQNGIRAFTQNTESMQSLQNDINTLSGQPNMNFNPESQTPEDTDKDRKHRILDGCQQGLCEGTNNACQNNNDCDGKSCNFAWRRCTEDSSVSCVLDSDCGQRNLGSCKTEAPDLLLVPERNEFAATRDETRIMTTIAQQRADEVRVFVDDLKMPSEFPSSQKKQADARAADNGVETNVSIIRQLIAGFSHDIGLGEADMFARGVDPQLTIAQTLAPVRGVGSSLAQLAHDSTGLRQLVSRFAWFLRRTCTDRVCNGRLQLIIAIAQTDSCFPYTNGDFLSQSCDDPQWKQCLTDAKITGIKAPTDLGCKP